MKRAQWIMIVGLALAIFVVVAYIVTSSRTEDRRAAARAALDRRVEAAQAEAKARRELLGAEPAATVAAGPLDAPEIDALNEAIEQASNSEWTELTEEISNTDGPWPPELVARVKGWLEAHRDLLAQARALPSRGTDFEITVYSVEEIQEAVSRFGKLRGVARLLVVAADAHAAEGRIDEAVDLLRDVISVSDLMGAAPLVMTQMTRTVGYRLVLDTVQRLLSQHNLSSSHLDELDRALEHAHQRNQFAAAVGNEALLGVTTFHHMRDGTLGGILRPLVNMNEASYVEGMTALAEVAGQPYYEGAAHRDEMQRSSQDLPITHYVSRNLLRFVQPALLRSIEDQARHEARVDMARIAIALEREYQATGTYPASLDSIALDFGAAVPVDPFTGQPFRYHVEGDRFVLYSVGSDLADDAGASGRDGDIVWSGP